MSTTETTQPKNLKQHIVKAIGGTDDSAFPVALACTLYVMLGPVAVALVLLSIY